MELGHFTLCWVIFEKKKNYLQIDFKFCFRNESCIRGFFKLEETLTDELRIWSIEHRVYVLNGSRIFHRRTVRRKNMKKKNLT